ncbi:hypothetical protein [Bradyrhizobium centrosematis]|uniref:hypothetical protein n=1 Tax=Bradyrhizobium centrosematis TaxID=1300039 RepID=UPI003890E53F
MIRTIWSLNSPYCGAKLEHDRERQQQGASDSRHGSLSQVEDSAEIVVGGGEDHAGGVLVPALKMTAAKVPIALHVADHRLDD